MPEPTMSLQEFGAKIKSKYPVYEQLSDTAIAQKVLEKYPQYKTSIRPATPADAAAIRAQATARFKPTGELRAHTPTAGDWLADAERDVIEGGGRTAIGRGLGRMQGGAHGYSGLFPSPHAEGPAELVHGGLSLLPQAGGLVGGVIGAGVGSPSGPGAVATTALGAGAGGVLGEDVRQMLEQAIFHEHIGGKESAIGMAKQGTLQAATAGAGVALGSIPMKSVAGKLLASVEKDAGHLPVNLTHSSDELLRVKELADAGGTMPTAIRKLLARATEPGGRPLTYSEMRNYYSNITSLSAREKMGLSPIMRRQLGITAAALKQDIADTAAVVGRSADYFHGMREYAQAAKLERAATEMKKWAIRAAGVGATAELAKLVWNTGPPKAAGVRR